MAKSELKRGSKKSIRHAGRQSGRKEALVQMTSHLHDRNLSVRRQALQEELIELMEHEADLSASLMRRILAANIAVDQCFSSTKLASLEGDFWVLQAEVVDELSALVREDMAESVEDLELAEV